MRSRPLDPLHLDIRTFADRAAELDGEISLCELARLVDITHPEARPTVAETLRWRARGELRPVRGEPAQPWLHLNAEAVVRLTCQRCLQAVQVPLQIDADFRFVADEQTAVEHDADAQEDLLVESRAFNLPALIEDEMLLALPLIPRHESGCPQPLQAPADPVAAAIELAPLDKPFAVLAGLKLRKTSD